MNLSHRAAYQLVRALIITAYLNEFYRRFQQQLKEENQPKTASAHPPKSPKNTTKQPVSQSQTPSPSSPNPLQIVPPTSQFLQTDPLGYHDSMNMYQGMFMNPQNYLDPFGQWSDLQNYLFRLKKKKGEKTAISWIENNITSGADKLALTMQMMYCTYDPDDPAASMGGVLYHWIAGMVDDVYDTFAKSWYGNFRKLALYNDADAGKRFIAENVFYAAFPYLLKGGAKLLARVS